MSTFVTAGTDGVYVAIDEVGHITYIDPQRGALEDGGTLPGKVVSPLAIAMNTPLSPAYGEQCIVIDAAGHVWVGAVRNEGGFRSVGGGPIQTAKATVPTQASVS